MYTIYDKKLLMLRPEEIKSTHYKLRHTFDEYELKLLADSISVSGIIQPLAVRKNSDGKYELIAGERRLRAAVIAGLRRIPCVVHKADDSTAAVYSLIENLQRSNLTVFEAAEAIDMLINEYGMSQSEVATRLGFSQSTLSNKLRLLGLGEELRKRITAAGLTERHARALLRLPLNERNGALDRIIAEGMTVKQTEELIALLLEPKPENPPEEPEKPFRKSSIGDMRLFGNSLSKLVDTLQNSGINAGMRKYENDKYIEYKVRIKKEPIKSLSATQLKIC